MSYSIGEVAAKLGLTKDGLRYYEKEGLLPPIARNESGHRAFSESDIDWIYFIKCLRDMDVPINKIKRYVSLIMESGGDSIPERCSMLKEQEIIIKDKIKASQNLLLLIEKKLEFYNHAMNTEIFKTIRCMDYSAEWEYFRSTLRDTQ